MLYLCIIKICNMNRSSFSFSTALFLVVMIALAACGSSKRSTTSRKRTPRTTKPVKKYAVNFTKSTKLSTAMDKARREGKLVFVDIYTDWCAPCKMMDKDVFMDKGIGNYLNNNFVSVKVNAEKGSGPNISQLYGVQVFPTLLFLDVDGKVLTRKDGAAYHSELRRLGDSAMAHQASL